MKDNLSIIITMIVMVLLMVIFPLYNYFERQDDMSYNLVLKETANFADEVLNSGYITQEMYNRYVSKITNTGLAFDIQLEAHKKVLTEDQQNAAEYQESYIIDYNQDIFDANTNAQQSNVANVNDKSIKNGVYQLNKGDQFYVKTKNSSTTMAGAIFETIVPTSSKDRVVANYGGIVKNNAWEQVNISNQYIQDISVQIVRTAPEPATEGQILRISDGPKITYEITVNNAEGTKEQVKQAIQSNFVIKPTGTDMANTTFSPDIVREGEIQDKMMKFYADFQIKSNRANDYLGTANEKEYQGYLKAGAIQGFINRSAEIKKCENDTFRLSRANASSKDIEMSGPTSVPLGQDATFTVKFYGAAYKGPTSGISESALGITRNFDCKNVDIKFAGDTLTLTYKEVIPKAGVTNGQYVVSLGNNGKDNWAEIITIVAGATKTTPIGIKSFNKFTISNIETIYQAGITRGQTFTTKVDGKYRLEVWGACGGGNDPFNYSIGSRGGTGGYSAGTVTLKSGDELWVFVGMTGNGMNGGWNGGGNGHVSPDGYGGTGFGGGGATDIRIKGNGNGTNGSTDNRLIVAGGGGGSDNATVALGSDDGSGGSGGGKTGGYGLTNGSEDKKIAPGTQTGTWKFQGESASSNVVSHDAGGGGGGYYGGHAGITQDSGGAGGSGFIGGYASYRLTDTITTNGKDPLYYTIYKNGTVSGGRNGYAKITYLGK